MDLEDRLNNYKRKVDLIMTERESTKENILAQIRKMYDPNTQTGRENSMKVWQKAQALADQASLRSTPFKGKIEVTHDNSLKLQDDFFFDTFKLHKYYPVAPFSYPVVYCETLEEFCEAYVQDKKLSEKEKQELVRQTVEQFFQKSQSDAYIYGVDISGVGCFINGWAFGKSFNVNPKDVLKEPQLAKIVAETAVHEKLGHGFLSMFSTLGQELHMVGSGTIREAAQIDSDVYTNPVHRLRYGQHQALLSSSMYQQEGWSTWIESFFAEHYFQTDSHPKYTFEKLHNAILKLNCKNNEEKQMKDILIMACTSLVNENVYTPEELLVLMGLVKLSETVFDEQIQSSLSQDLRYVLGFILMYQVELNAGIQCVPHAALLAGNLKLNVDQIGLQDLKVLLETDPRLNTDTRLAMISKIKLNNLDDVTEFATRCEQDLSMPVPAIYKQSG